jgi:hypothetical protein
MLIRRGNIVARLGNGTVVGIVLDSYQDDILVTAVQVSIGYSFIGHWHEGLVTGKGSTICHGDTRIGVERGCGIGVTVSVSCQ